MSSVITGKSRALARVARIAAFFVVLSGVAVFAWRMQETYLCQQPAPTHRASDENYTERFAEPAPLIDAARRLNSDDSLRQRSPVARTSASALREADASRLFLIRPRGYLHVGEITVPGFYVMVIFSASWCGPCSELRQEVPRWLALYPNVVVVDIDISVDPSGATRAGGLLEAFGESTSLPAALVFNPLGLYINRGDGGLAPPHVGYDDIVQTFRNFAGRTYQEALAMDSAAAFAALERMQRESQHYARGRGSH